MKDKFTGSSGERHLLDALLEQQLFRGEAAIAKAVADTGELEELAAGKTLVSQGDRNDDIFFLLVGEVDVFVNERFVASRKSGETIGEMASLSPTVERSATVVANRDSLVFRVTEETFRGIADANPGIWRSLGKVVADRLRQREQFHHSPNASPVLFIGSSVEGLPVANAIVSGLKHAPLVARPWTTPGLFSPGAATVETLLDEVTRADFAAFVFGPDDKIASRDEEYYVPRDNVVFELGLFMGQLDRKRAFVIHEHGCDIKIPTDLLGMTAMNYVRKPGDDLSGALLTVCNELGEVARSLGAR